MNAALDPATPLRILVVEDEPDLASMLEYVLGREGFETTIARSVQAALDAIERQPPDLLLLDLMLPDGDGLDVLTALRRSPHAAHTRVIILSAKQGEDDRVRGLELGAHDYVAKPFSPRELVLRVRSALARDRSAPAERNVLRAGPIEVELDQHEVLVDGKRVQLTLTEFRLLAALLRNMGRVRSREALLTEVWGYHSDAISRTVDTHVRRLRHKLGPGASWIDTVRGVGYRIQDPRLREG